MKVGFGDGCSIELTAKEVESAIEAWLISQGVTVSGPRTIKVNGKVCSSAQVHIDTAGAAVVVTQNALESHCLRALNNYTLSNISATYQCQPSKYRH